MNGSANNRNFFVFDLTGVADTILSAVLRLENPQTVNNGIASTYTLYDVSTGVASLMADQSGATGIYADLGTGTSYGSAALSSSVSPGFVEISLNTTAISALNSTSGLFALGGSLSVVGSTPAQLFTGTSGPEYIRTLILEVEQPVIPPSTGVVPEPMSFAVWSTIALVSGLGAFARQVKGANRTDQLAGAWPDVAAA